MNETHATISSGAPNFPSGRYGRRRDPRRGRGRPLLIGLAVAVVVAGLTLVSIQQYRMYGDPTYDAEVITYTEITDDQILVDFRVTVPEGGSAICTLRARDKDGFEVAREQVTVNAPPGEQHLTARHRLTTTSRPFIGEVMRCREPA
ncbi:DUF4307 domain-containing protein [Micromonospora sp. NPDC000207]|uniref:DUF4307 domain-containing protein n=1 Tax=Micromonospora sp. NPDC000207 TaxID=3154246 RepID=UPI0033235AD2